MLCGLVLFLIITILYCWYSNIIRNINQLKFALSIIDTQLNLRVSLIPDFLKIAESYLTHEKNLLAEIVTLREKSKAHYNVAQAGTIKDYFNLSNQLAIKMNQLQISLGYYPEFKTNQTLQSLIQSYQEIEAQITAAKRLYNAAAQKLNGSIQIFPGSFMGGLLKIKIMPYYEKNDLKIK